MQIAMPGGKQVKVPWGFVAGFGAAGVIGLMVALLMTLVFGGSSADSAVSIQQGTDASARASGPAPATSATGEENTTVPSQQKTTASVEQAPVATSPQASSQPVFLPIGTKTDNLFVGVGTRSEDEQFRSIVLKDINSHRDAGGLAIHLGLATATGLAKNNLNPLAIDSVPERLRGVVENPDVLQGVGAAFLSYDGSGSQPKITRVAVSRPSTAVTSSTTEETSFVVTLYRAYSYGEEEQHEYDARAVPREDNKGWMLTGWCARTGLSLYCS